jgi:DNA-binding LytR/AlgR family response regulator
MNATALIAEDEPVLAQALATMLSRLWPHLTLLPPAQDGGEAITRAIAELPDILFLDIHMPDRDGLDAAEAIVDAWPATQALPLIVFVTAYDQYALAAFERAAVDYVLKPVQTARMAATCERLQAQLKLRAAAQSQDDGALAGTLQALRSAALDRQADISPSTPLTVIQAAMGSGLVMIPIDDVHYFEAADKYVRVITASVGANGSEVLIRTPLRELVPRLNPQHFWQVHRSAVVSVKAIERVTRVNGRMRVHLRGRPETLEVSRMYAYQFKAM